MPVDTAVENGSSGVPPQMRVAVVHSFYSSDIPSGENQAVTDQLDALHRAGHRMHLVAVHTDEVSGSPFYPLRAAATVSSGRGRSPLDQLRRLRPDIVHVHNLFPNFGRSWLRHWAGPIVTTLHNYRPLCAAATLYRNGATCTLCPDGDRWAGLRNGCYRGSRTASAPLAWAGRHGVTADALLGRADRVVVLSATSRQMYLSSGIDPQRLVLVPNFTSDFGLSAPIDHRPEHSPANGTAWVFAGRLSPEKGLLELLARWPAGERLDVVGQGPLLDACRRAAPEGVRFLGRLDHLELRRRLPSWRGLVFPSRWLEAAPLIYPEALAAGLPVLAFSGSAVADSVREDGTGTVVAWEEALAPALSHAGLHFPTLRHHCRSVFLRQYSERAWTARIESVYASALASRRPSPRDR
ncbi:glycosyltransferase family 4 protein [Streptomyces sp. PSKA54]|uniref:Glycosyltransferase family 4 protein n=1 Tax=Streptomyces himalayensis subsp. aureolus TaxID=2758039 RepID=A0A7W2CXM0_9ACTN|nr:glycosyltransferase family 4 protein [Streptomyces himalayensis]MBA4860961.1 glycosyltransferase family 4 protein [Streptomyces himalayensis subsp. aureolus]